MKYQYFSKPKADSLLILIGAKMANKDYDVIVVGGGPAGLFAAIVCARNGLSTLVIEKQQYPVDKACGEGIMPSGVDRLIELGTAKFIQKTDFQCFRGIRYVSVNGLTAQADFENGVGWGIQRTILSTALLESANSLTNLEVRQGLKAGCRLGVNWEITIEDKVHQPKLLIAADGLHSRMRKKAGLEISHTALKRWGVRKHLEIKPWSEYVEIYWGSGLEAYVTPVSENRVNVNFLWDSKKYKPQKKGEQLFAGLLEEFPELEARLMKANVIDEAKAVGPLHQKTNGVAHKNMILIGDASGFYDPITGEGISLASKQALFLEQYIIPALKQDNSSLQKAMMDYSKACKKIVVPYKAMTSMVLLLRLWPWGTEQIIRILNKMPGFFQKLLTANMR